MLVHHRGFSLIDVIVGVALMLVLFLALFGVLRASLEVSALAKAKATAVEIGSTQIEYLRGLAYDSLGTLNGIPAGNVPQVATSTVDGIPYTIRTYIEYFDDTADGQGVSDTNHVTTDYKIGKITVSYSIHGVAKSVVLVSNFVPPGIESSTGGGTLSLHIVDALGNDVPDADVQIINASTSPTINLTTVSDTTGLVLIGGAATSSMYQIFASRPGYSSAQTYARTSQNVNPTPGYLTVVKDQTTSATFAIDRLATLTLSSLSPATTTVFSDTFVDASNLFNQTNTQVTGGDLTLVSQVLSGSARSISISPSALDGWGLLSASIATSSGTMATIQVANTSGTLLPDADLPGNSAGFSSFPVSLTDLATSTYPGLTIQANLTSDSTTTAPSIHDWSLSYTTGPTALSNTSFTLTGAKTIGTNGSGLPIYKTTINDTTGASGMVIESLEWDAYTLTLGGGANLIDSCEPSPYALAPAQASSTSLLIGALSTNTLPLLVENSASSTIASAKIVLTKSGYAATVSTSACGLAFFNNLASDTYTATVSATGYTTKVFSNITVVGHTPTTTLVLP